MLTAQEAANEVNRSKPAILKAIKTGRLSANKNGKGEWEIDPAELFRVYTKKKVGSRKLAPEYPPETEKLAVKIELLELKLEKTSAQLEREKEIAEDFQKERDHWRIQATNLLTNQRPQSKNLNQTEVTTTEPPKIQFYGLLDRLKFVFGS